MNFLKMMHQLSNMVREKFSFHYRLYQRANIGKQFVFLRYIIFILVYRKFLCYVFCIPLIGIYCLIYPFCKIRFFSLVGAAMGHFAQNTERLIIYLKRNPDKKFINIFYLPNSGFEPPISNQYLLMMWKRVIPILPIVFSPVVIVLDKFLSRIKSNSLYNVRGMKKRIEGIGFGPDVDGYFRSEKPLLSFTDEEHKRASDLLAKINLKSEDRFVCLLVRSSDYNAQYQNWNDFPERNADVQTYAKACYFLAEKGYHVLRMGKSVKDHFTLHHPNIIDYAQSDIRCDFLDIYLTAHCAFFISTSTGLESVAEIFRRPILVTNSPVLNNIAVYYPHYLLMFKIARFHSSGDLLTFDKQAHIPFHTLKKLVRENKIDVIDNTEEEILEAVMEMESRLTGNWIEIRSDSQWQENFQEIFNSSRIDAMRCKEYHVRIARNFLLKYKALLSYRSQNDQEMMMSEEASQ